MKNQFFFLNFISPWLHVSNDFVWNFRFSSFSFVTVYWGSSHTHSFYAYSWDTPTFQPQLVIHYASRYKCYDLLWGETFDVHPHIENGNEIWFLMKEIRDVDIEHPCWHGKMEWPALNQKFLRLHSNSIKHCSPWALTQHQVARFLLGIPCQQKNDTHQIGWAAPTVHYSEY